MKKLVYTFLALLCGLAGYSQQLLWDEPIVVNDDLLKGYARPRIEANSDGKPVVMWGKATNREIYVSVGNGQGFNDPVQITPEGMTAFVQSWAGPGIASLGDTIMVAFKSQPDEEGYVYLAQSFDGGLSFDTVRVNNDHYGRFPEVAIAPNGLVVVKYMEHNEEWMEPMYSTTVSTDGGKNFGPMVHVAGGAVGESCDCCPGFVMADEDQIITLWRNNEFNLRDMWISISEDQGETFTGSDIDNNTWIINSCPSTGPDAIRLGDTVVATWMSGASGFSRVNVGEVNSTDVSSNFNFEITPGVEANQNYPRIGGNNKVVGVVWQEVVEGNLEIQFAYSFDGVVALDGTNAETVNVDALGSQLNPDVVFANDAFHFVWQDQRSKAVIYRRARVDYTNRVTEIGGMVLQLYPNPSSDEVRLKGLNGTLANVEVYNSVGQLVAVYSGIEGFSVKDYAPGIYRVGLELNDKKMWQTLKVK